LKPKDLIPLLILCIGLFLAPIIGGQIRVDSGFSLLNSGIGAIIDGEWAMGALAVLASFMLIPLIMSIALRKVQHVPSWHLWVPLSLFLGSFILSGAWSDFPQASQDMIVQWCVYGAAFFSVVAVVGRKQGLSAAIGCIIGGATIAATRGILEYSSMKTIDPTWRIFGGWINPNALAGMLVLSLILTLGMLGNQERLVKLLVGASATLQGLALLLTQSKGGFLALAVGLICFISLLAVRKQGKMILATGVVVGLIVLLGFGVQSSSKSASGASAMIRMGQRGETAQQSEGFRTLLWQGAIQGIKNKPLGTGIGTYRFESARTGFHPQTALAHQSFLQVGFEGGIISLILLVSFMVMWCVITLRGYRNLPPDRAQIYAGIFAALVASSVHCLVDSDWYYMGIGLLVFVLMGLGVQCAQDSSSPEFTRRHNLNVIGLTACILVLISSILPAYRDSLIARANQLRMSSDIAESNQVWSQVMRIFPTEPSSYRAYRPEGTESDEILALQRAVRVHPSTANLRALAVAQSKNPGMISTALVTLHAALKRDPKNLPTLLLQMKLAVQQPDEALAKRVLEQIISIESTPYYLNRALPEIVPTETFEARMEYIKLLKETPQKKKLLLEAIKGLMSYIEITAPKTIQFGDSLAGFGGETVADAIEKCQLLLTTTNQLNSAKLNATATEIQEARAASNLASKFLGQIENKTAN